MKEVFEHFSVMGEEAPRELVINPDGLYVDGTFGRGGHSRRILKMLSEKGRLIAFDRDPEAIEAAKQIDDPRFEIIHAPFSHMKQALNERGIERVDGIFLDIGVSSPQIDDAERGFSFRMDGPLDMRMDTSCGMTAAQWLAQEDEGAIARVISELGEERFARQIARAICKVRQTQPILTTKALAALVASVVPVNKKDPTQNPATRTFQAIRIHINGELDELTQALEAAMDLLSDGARIAIISFHSLEDRIVKRFYDRAAHPEKSIDPRLPLRADQLPQPDLIHVRRILPSKHECEINARSRSAILRVATRVRH